MFTRPRKHILLEVLSCLLLLPQVSFTQVNNNSIANRILLTVDEEPFQSSTNQSTVEWECINKKLTERCLIYHNDQWFTFSPPHNGTFYLNISEQLCRKKYGVQVLLIEGNPCETSTYKLLHCESFTNQSDTFIQLSNLRTDTQYLINIDGFLGDVCGFKIQVGNRPNGLPLKSKSLDTLRLTAKREKEVVLLQWKIDEHMADSLNYFEVYRQLSSATKTSKQATIPLHFNALGQRLTEYEFLDSLDVPATYLYSVIGVFHDEKERMLLDEQEVHFSNDSKSVAKQYFSASIPLDYKKKGDVDFLIMNAATGEVLFKQICHACSEQVITLDLTNEVRLGVTRFWIETLHSKTKEQHRYIFYLDKEGKLVRK